MVNNVATHCSILLKFGTEFDHMTPYLIRSRSRNQRSRLQLNKRRQIFTTLWGKKTAPFYFCNSFVI